MEYTAHKVVEGVSDSALVSPLDSDSISGIAKEVTALKTDVVTDRKRLTKMRYEELLMCISGMQVRLEALARQVEFIKRSIR